MEKNEQNKNPKLAIVGMDCFLGGCQGLDAFERSIYEVNQHFTTFPYQRWQEVKTQNHLLKNNDFDTNVAPLGAYIKDFEIDFSDFKLASEEDKFKPQELLMLKVADNAIKDVKLNKGSRVAVIIVAATELSLRILKPEAKDTISNLWNFAGPLFTLVAEQHSIFKALEVAKKLLAIGEVDAVVVGAVELAENSLSLLVQNQTAKSNTGINTLSYDQNVNGWMLGEGAAAVVLKLHTTAQQDNDCIYAVVDALNILKDNSSSHTISDSKSVTQVCQLAFDLAGIKPTDIGYLEVFASGVPQQDESEILGLIRAYQTSEPDLCCAIGSVKANIGHTYAASGIVSLIKTALCLYHRYIPGVPHWSAPKMAHIWQNSPFYVAPESKPWFLEKGATKRIAAINSMEIDGSYAHLILSEEAAQIQRRSRYLEQMPFYLFALAADDCPALLEQLHTLQQTIANSSSLSAAASLTFRTFQQRQNATYALAIFGRNQQELTREIQRAIKGIADAFNTGKDWQTPVGSYFTPKPLGNKGNVAFVYPGAYSSYLGIARNLFRLFPKIYEDPIIKSVYTRVNNIEKILYPRSLSKLSTNQLETLEQQFINDPVAMLESEVGVAGLLTAVLRNYFQLQPQCAFGYSLGETSMMLSQGIWTHFHEGSEGLNSSALFKTQLSGPKNAVRKYWELPQIHDGESEEFWSTYVLMCPVSRVREVLKHEERVYLILINTPEEVAIAGDTKACQRVIKTLNCDAFSAPFNHVIHCEPMRCEYDALVKLNTLPTQNVPNTVFYSAAEYKPITLNSDSIGHNIAKMLVQQLDFPRLIQRVWEDGARIFLEVGAGSNCSRWISGNLTQKEHMTVSLNKRGIDEHSCIVKALAKLLSHRVKMDLSSLYSQVQENTIKSHPKVRTITWNSNELNITPLKDQEKKIFQDTSSTVPIKGDEKQQYKLLDFKEFERLDHYFQQNFVNSFEFAEKQKQTNVNTIQHENYQFVSLSSSITHICEHQDHMINFRNQLYQNLIENTSRLTKTHSIFLENRQQLLLQISAIIQLQLDCLQHIFQAESSVSEDD
ncbi:PfaB family protein [Pelatocladus sp. BLCC-F211]|uniref:PfaB family protein n=1 Tax=Pelatocladus sp. BLCC-F211 TaxID=3342752 RepID=UPI0035B6AE0B